MQIRCASCGSTVPVADTGVLPAACPHCKQTPVPARLGRFKVVRLLAAGGMGEVYLGEHEELGSRVALKLLPTPDGADAEAIAARFRREAKLTAAIDHPGVVQVLDQASDHGRMFLVLELVDGRSLRSRLREGPLPVAEAVRITAAAADVLGAAHAAGVVHRDVKPENVMLCRDGRVRVLDFGIARALQDQEPLTRTGEILGTPEYMAPEQLLDEASSVDARADVHALALLGYELLTGRSPFAGSSLFAALKLVESLVPPPPSRLRREVPAALDAVVLRGLAKNRDERFADGAAFADALRRALAAAGVTAAGPQRGRTVLVTAAVALLAVTLLALALGPRTCAGSAGGDRAAAAAAGRVPTSAELRPELEQLLAQPALTGTDRDRARELAAQTAAATDGPTLLASGRALLRLGSFHAALTRLDRATQLGETGARATAAVAWHCVHTLLPACIDAPPWFALVDRARRERLLGLGEAADAPTAVAGDGDALLLAACRDLAHGAAKAAWQRLAPAEAGWSEDHAAIALLAARLTCADPATLAAVAARAAARFPAPAVQLAAGDAVAAGERLRELAADQEVASADRWLFELTAAIAGARAGAEPPPRLRAAAELAWLHGSGGLAPCWLALARATAAMRGAPLPRDEATRLQTLFAGDFGDEAPARDLARALLLLPTDAAAAQQTLQQAKLPDERALALFIAWRDAEPATAAVFAAVLRGDRGGPFTLPPADTAPRGLAHALAALADGDPDRRRAHWQQALAQPFDAEVLQAFMPPPASLAELHALLVESAAATPPAAALPGWRGALRLCARAGVDLGPLRARFLQELCDGVH